MVGFIVEDIEDDVRPSSALPLGLPDELAEWVHKNHELVMRVQQGLRSSYAEEITPQKLLEIVAAASNDPDFMKAQGEKLEAEKIWNELSHPTNAPLGLIGLALESDESVYAHERYISALANFTIISEGLMERRPDLAKLLNVLLVQKRMLDQSLSRSRQVLKAAQEMAEMFSLRDVFRRNARGPSLISRQFKASMSLFRPKKQVHTAGVVFPWSAGI